MKVSTTKRSPQEAFTMAELLAVIVVLAMLAMTLLPALGSTQNRSQRISCLNNLRQLGVGLSMYAGSFNDRFFPALQATVQIAVGASDALAASHVGLSFSDSNSASLWSCPGRSGYPLYDPHYSQWTIGYQYFGGIFNWKNPYGTMPSYSPVKLSQSRAHWTLAADTIIRAGGVWSGPSRDDAALAMVPTHCNDDSIVPQGGNQVFVDGSAQWIRFEQMHFLHSWSTLRPAYFYQDPKDFPGSLRAMLPNLRATP
jgi:type II secretory pathway pseudopilin PulG